LSYIYLVKLEPSFKPAPKELIRFGDEDKLILRILFRRAKGLI